MLFQQFYFQYSFLPISVPLFTLNIDYLSLPRQHRGSQDSFLGGHYLGSALLGVRGRRPPEAGQFSKIFKRFLNEIAKMHYFSMFFEKFSEPCINFSSVWSKNANDLEILRKFRMKIIQKIEFLISFENLLLTIETSEITPFSTTFFRFRPGGFLPSPLASPLLGRTT